MPISRTTNDFDSFSDWESFEGDDDIYMGIETDLLDDWEDDGAIAEVREAPIEKPKPIAKKKLAAKKPAAKKKTPAVIPSDTSVIPSEVEESSKNAEVFSLVDHTNAKSKNDLVAISGPSEEELLEIENIGVESYIDSVLLDDSELVEIDAELHITADDDKTDIMVNDEIDLTNEDDFGVTILPKEMSIKDRILAYEEMEAEVETLPVVASISIGDDDEIDLTRDDVDLNVKPLFSGLGCMLVTLFDEDLEVEYKLTARLAKRLSESNTNAIVVASRDGEGATLSDVEKIKLVKEVKKSVGSKAKIVADVTCASTRQSVALTKEYVDAGVDSLIIEIDANTNDVYQLVESVHKAAYETSIILRLSGDPKDLPIAPEFLYDLPIDGIIDATGDASYLLHLTSAYSGPIYIGSTSLILMAHSLGVQGVVLASIAGDENLVKNAFQGDVDAQHELAMIERDYGNNAIEQIKIGLENAFLISPMMRS